MTKSSKDDRPTEYFCKYSFNGEIKCVVSTEGLSAFKDGFWINERFEHTKLSDCKYWIPPSAVIYVQKTSFY